MLYRIRAREYGSGSCEPIGLGHHQFVLRARRTVGLFCTSCKHVFEAEDAHVRAEKVTCTDCGVTRELTKIERQVLITER